MGPTSCGGWAGAGGWHAGSTRSRAGHRTIASGPARDQYVTDAVRCRGVRPRSRWTSLTLSSVPAESLEHPPQPSLSRGQEAASPVGTKTERAREGGGVDQVHVPLPPMCLHAPPPHMQSTDSGDTPCFRTLRSRDGGYCPVGVWLPTQGWGGGGAGGGLGNAPVPVRWTWGSTELGGGGVQVEA